MYLPISNILRRACSSCSNTQTTSCLIWQVIDETHQILTSHTNIITNTYVTLNKKIKKSKPVYYDIYRRHGFIYARSSIFNTYLSDIILIHVPNIIKATLFQFGYNLKTWMSAMSSWSPDSVVSHTLVTSQRHCSSLGVVSHPLVTVRNILHLRGVIKSE